MHKGKFSIRYLQHEPPKPTGPKKRCGATVKTKKCFFLPSAHNSPWCLVYGTLSKLTARDTKGCSQRIIFGLEGTLNINYFQPPSTGRDTFH